MRRVDIDVIETIGPTHGDRGATFLGPLHVLSRRSHKRVGNLSGGRRARVEMAKLIGESPRCWCWT